MIAYEKVFRKYADTLSPEDLNQEARLFYVRQVRIILGWIDLTDTEQLQQIRSLDKAFYDIVEN
ncbi:hypothetical protein [Paenibacillus apiarius]|uniref:hypothetical protein n=1 Tax=Paenibacillus apiarius TaxID=46240 RepID=UPI003B3ACE6E